MRHSILFVFVFFLTFNGMTQNPKFDKLEMNFAQRHYKRVYRKAKRLLDNPEYDFSQLPKYYKSISLFQLCQNEFWLERHPTALKEAEKLFLEVRNSSSGQNIFNAHMYEISWLRSDMVAWAADLKRMGQQSTFDNVQRLIDSLFNGVPSIDEGNSANDLTNSIDSSSNLSNSLIGIRNEILETAKKHIGTPYVWAGSSPEGFDCSGFTSYVMKEHGQGLPRRAADQYIKSTKIKRKNAQQGDLVFFNNGSGISHVGIVVSKQGEPLVMIHSSSSKGIIITEVEKSQYWMKRLHGFGTYVK
ncbi:MAG: C40 family peptidase [Crocinitomicaceae bacterium]|nr:C40 family peptidase [Crocinitomicaceae bacterium]